MKLKREFKAIGRGRNKVIRERGFKPRQSLWELDHIVPLIDGGGHEDDNLQSLCTPCHSEKTAQEARTRAERNRVAPSDAPPEETPPGAPSKLADATPSRATNRKKTKKRSVDLDELIASADATNARVSEILAEIGQARS